MGRVDKGIDVGKSKMDVINWFGQAKWSEQYSLMRSLIGALPAREVKAVENMCNKQRRISKRKADPGETTNIKSPRVESVPFVPAPPEEKQAWWSRYERSEVVALDCEHVHYIHEVGENRIKTGTISIVDVDGKEIYFAKVTHPKNSFTVNKHTIAKTGFRNDSLEDGKPMEVVMREVDAILTNKLVVSYQGTMDIQSLRTTDDQLNAGDYDHFDLSEFFKRPKPNKFGEDYGEKISLRTLMYHYFNEDIQSGVHSPKVDAAATMKLFRKVYRGIDEVKFNRQYKHYEMFEHIVKYNP